MLVRVSIIATQLISIFYYYLHYKATAFMQDKEQQHNTALHVYHNARWLKTWYIVIFQNVDKKGFLIMFYLAKHSTSVHYTPYTK